ncbi:MAG: hypothetical protein E4H26_11155 [Flavobacteriales bacterium]|nr:MAG: hypothetical protein E4H26_11155 [Flavobacteriales bacterium]
MLKLEHFVILCVSFFIGGCSATNQLTMGAVEPARVSIPNDVTKIGIINRSIPSEGNKTIDKLDQILSLEGLRLDKEGANAAVTGLYDELTGDDRFESVALLESTELERKGLGVFPAALNWETVGAICEANDVEVLFSLELYDTDTQIDYETAMVEIPNNLGIKASVPGHKVTLNTLIKSGWRIYDPLTKSVLDEWLTNDRVTSHGQGINPVRAVEAVIGRKEAVMQQSTYGGNSYASSIRPRSKRIAREYFVKGTDNFVTGKRRAQTGDWDGAAQLWTKDLDHPKAKVAGRAYYNMAISNEINGDLEKAMDLASKSYSDYNNKVALRYLNQLRYRMAEKEELHRQLSR